MDPRVRELKKPHERVRPKGSRRITRFCERPIGTLTTAPFGRNAVKRLAETLWTSRRSGVSFLALCRANSAFAAPTFRCFETVEMHSEARAFAVSLRHFGRSLSFRSKHFAPKWINRKRNRSREPIILVGSVTQIILRVLRFL